MIIDYNKFLNEKISDKLSGFNEEELKQQFLKGEIDFKKYLNICFQNNLRTPNDEILKKELLNSDINSLKSILNLYKSYDKKLPNNDIIKYLYDENIIDLEKYVSICKTYYNFLPNKLFIENEINKLENKIFFYVTMYKNFNYEFNISDILKNALYNNKIDIFHYLYYCDECEIKPIDASKLITYIDEDKYNDLLCIAISYNDEEIIKFLLNIGVKLTEQLNNDLVLPYYHTSITSGNLELLKILNDAYEGYINIKHQLILAAENNKIEIVKYLINNGADIEILYSMLNKLIFNDNYDIVKFILENGGEINRKVLNLVQSDKMMILLKKYI